MKKIALLALVLVFFSTTAVIQFTKPVIADGTIYIKADGSVEGTDKIQRDGNVYTFTANIYDEIVVERDNIVVDGAGYTLQGPGNGTGIYLSGRSNVTIKDMEIKVFEYGIRLYFSSNITISGNDITTNTVAGIKSCSTNKNNSISGNDITNNNIGIRLSSSYCSISGNNIINNKYGIGINGSYNKFYHNNFIDNSQQVYGLPSTNVWDNGIEGNYWSNYTGVDLDRDGIGDSSHEVYADNTDNYPLVGLFSSFKASLGYHVNVISNSTLENFQYFESNSTVKLYVSNMTTTQTFGFCRVCIPKGLISPPYTVIIDDGLTPVLHQNYTLYDNGIHRWIYFAYEHSTRKVVIQGLPPPDTTPPTISILSPENKTYPAKDVSLTFTASEPPSWMGYSLDGQTNVTITGNTTLSGLVDGSHSLIIYAKDTAGNTGASEIIYFSIKTQKAEPFPTWIVAIVTIAVVGSVLLVYFARVSRKQLKKSN